MSHLVYAYLDVDLERKKIEIEIVQIPGQNTPYRIVSVGGVRAGIRICSVAVCIETIDLKGLFLGFSCDFGCLKLIICSDSIFIMISFKTFKSLFLDKYFKYFYIYFQ